MSVSAEKLFAVQVLRNLDFNGPRPVTVEKLARGRQARRRVRAALQLAARERLVVSPDAGRSWRLTEKALAILHPERVAA